MSILGASAAAIVGGLIARGTVRRSSRTERTDEYRREVRLAASEVVVAANAFVEAASAFDSSIFWIRDAVQGTPGHEDRYLACRTARVELDKKISDFDFLVAATLPDPLPSSVFAVRMDASMAYHAMFDLRLLPDQQEYTEDQLEEELEEIRKYRRRLDQSALPRFIESVKKHMAPTIIDEKRRRERGVSLLKAVWRWLEK